MPTAFVAVVLPGSPPVDSVLRAAGATAVLRWSELATSDEPGDTLAVLFDVGVGQAGAAGLVDDVAAVLDALTSAPEMVVATVRPVTDTLKLVDAEGFLAGTAEREQHRFVGTPIAARLQALRALALNPSDGLGRTDSQDGTSVDGAGPTPLALLVALVERGATVLAGHA
jgi:2-C-methyl-D-erythritol 4-phosphate cytidylyltransferase